MFLRHSLGAAVLALAFTIPTSAAATEIGHGGHPFGLGITVGYPTTGISGKFYVGGRRNAIEGVLATWSNAWERSGVYVHGVYLWHPSVLASDAGFELPWHVGVGGYFADGYRYGWGRDRWHDWRRQTLGVRVPVGLDFDLKDLRLQFSGDLAANVGIVPAIYVDVTANLSVRYYF